MRPTLLYSIIESLVAIPLTPRYMTLNDFEWLEWPFYVKFLLLRTALSASIFTVESVCTRDQRRCADVRKWIAIRRIFRIREKLRIFRRRYIVGTLPIMPTLVLFSINWLLLNL